VEASHDIRTVQELIGHADVSTSMIDTTFSTEDRPRFAARPDVFLS